MKLNEFKNNWNLKRFEIQRAEHREDASIWLYFFPDNENEGSSRALCFPNCEAMRVCNESYTLLLNQQWWEELPGKQVAQVSNSDWIEEIERQSFEGSLAINQREAVHYIVVDSEWVYEFIAWEPPQLIELDKVI